MKWCMFFRSRLTARKLCFGWVSIVLFQITGVQQPVLGVVGFRRDGPARVFFSFPTSGISYIHFENVMSFSPQRPCFQIRPSQKPRSTNDYHRSGGSFRHVSQLHGLNRI